jgi:gentisate 1,2-dioxygenase
MDNARAFHIKPGTSDQRRDFYARLETKNTAPLWEHLANLFPVEPSPACVPALWNYDDDIRPLLLEAGRLITAKEATRRVLILENPGIRGTSQITQSLYAGIQMILPGEIAPTHRHTASAIRFVIEGSGAYTAVDGERTTMHPGDFILTPSWTFHDHGNPTEAPCMWMDGLDFPIVNTLDAPFAETYPEDLQPVTRNEGDSLLRYGANMLPIEHISKRQSSPVFNYPYSRTREALDGLSRNGPLHPCHGIKMQYVDPATGGYPLPTIAAFMQLLPAGFRGTAYRSTDATIYCVVEGHGRTRIGQVTFDWKPRDIFVVPSWKPVAHEAAAESVLFSFSDRPAQKAFGFWREQAPTVPPDSASTSVWTSTG